MNLYAALLRRAPALPPDLEEYLTYVREERWGKRVPKDYYSWKQDQEHPTK